ncbi:alpha/beta family hydrolase [Pseudarthrobacter sp. NIBRBAC000502770]|uniref:alpha/beta hydrolase family protein n=1 Tax=Pseudarthrobacter sp. NIBRBAC000502770 TaxID=2590785 RepID=UPI0011404B00|nr:alpha/beta family hydrolase [Pseudarthrobacter sp. NIBRBAC000502770]QDG88289.1 dienelactone hydrolase [Pseudarthrobacter sp. NIBRBAC000502770]
MPGTDQQLTIPVGDGTVSAAYGRPGKPSPHAPTVVVAHGAGAGMEDPFLLGFTDALNVLGLATLRFNFPYREAGRKFPDRPPVAIATWRAVMDAAANQAALRGDTGPLVACGKSFGGRMASMAVAAGMPAAGLVYLGYPLHPPGKPDKLRDEHLYGLATPMLFLQGTRDTFATPHILEDVVSHIGRNAVLQWVEGGDHSFAVAGHKRPAGEVGASLAVPVAEFISSLE